MTNRDRMCALCTKDFELAMWSLYFNPKLWIEGDDIKKRSTPNSTDVQEWLDSTCNTNSEFWKYILEDNIND